MNTVGAPAGGIFNVLIIDDDPDDRCIIRELLESGTREDAQYSCVIVEAEGYEEGRQKLSAGDWHIVLVDHYLESPSRTGLRLIEELYKEGKDHPALLLVTGKSMVDFTRREFKILGTRNVRLLAKQNLSWQTLKENLELVRFTNGRLQDNTKVTSILILEDDRDDFDMIKDFLKDHEFMPICTPFCLVHARDIPEALDLLEGEDWDVFVVDYKLRGADTGLDCIHTARERGISVPTVIMSGYPLQGMGLTEHDEALLRSGELKYIHKASVSIESVMQSLGDYIVAFGV